MRQIGEGKVIVLTWGDLARQPERLNPRSDAWLNCKKSAEAIVGAKALKGRTVVDSSNERRCGNAKRAENWETRLHLRGAVGNGGTQGSAEYCHTGERREERCKRFEALG